MPVDQTQYGPDDSGLNQLGQTCVAPIVQDIQTVTADGATAKPRRMVKMATGSTRVASAEQKAVAVAGTPLNEPTVDTSAWDVSDNAAGDAEMIATFKDVVFAASAHAPRFKVLEVTSTDTTAFAMDLAAVVRSVLGIAVTCARAMVAGGGTDRRQLPCHAHS